MAGSARRLQHAFVVVLITSSWSRRALWLLCAPVGEITREGRQPLAESASKGHVTCDVLHSRPSERLVLCLRIERELGVTRTVTLFGATNAEAGTMMPHDVKCELRERLAQARKP